MLLAPGTHHFQRDEEPNRPMTIDYASASAQAPSYIKVYVGDVLIEHVYLSAGSPHTWWGNNPLFGRSEPAPGQHVSIEVGPTAIMRLESDLQVIAGE